ncbi:MAG: ATP synthase F1 subunit epsilon [Ruminococcaceae bacterium]|nr:ATP synthase F1 subunit epsilon [Oscillospiraceae bacterium]
MSTFNLKIVTLDGIIFDSEVENVVARTSVGDVCILKNHTDYIAPIELGRVKIKDEEGHERTGACTGGFISVSDSNTRIVATTFEFSEDIDVDRAERAKEKAEEKLKKDKASKVAEIKLKKALLRLEVSQKK